MSDAIDHDQAQPPSEAEAREDRGHSEPSTDDAPPMLITPAPCAGAERRCPWRKDADLTKFTAEDYRKLRRCNGSPGKEAWIDAPKMLCHKDADLPDDERRLCAGWLAVVGEDHLGVRVNVAFGAIPGSALARSEGWPALHGSLDEMLDAAWQQFGRHGRKPWQERD